LLLGNWHFAAFRLIAPISPSFSLNSEGEGVGAHLALQ
jgi:hypothetical protein